MKASDSDEEVAGESTRRRVDQSQGTERGRLLLALPGTVIGGCNIGSLRAVSGWNCGSGDSVVWSGALIPDNTWILCRSSLENDSSTKFESHSSSANSSHCDHRKRIFKFRQKRL